MPGQRYPSLDWPYNEGLRLDEAMQGHYELVFERPLPRHGPGSLEVTLVGLRGTVLTRSSLE